MSGVTYEQCEECKRLIMSHAEANACFGVSQFSFIAGKRTCWQCIDKSVEKLGVVPYRMPKAVDDTERAEAASEPATWGKW